ncbi:hypothetical protein [Woeseia oceani]|uniref:Uncharacterized protein n=1 Tax=Woeseia oceani TaxID=1548547 RepID=A0A193LJH3_9GAMM|nr:hypothetical protein [Woeseia oceani]ANO52583.1 hypothetical protein BA177_16580 [Woeseia oceani]
MTKLIVAGCILLLAACGGGDSPAAQGQTSAGQASLARATGNEGKSAGVSAAKGAGRALTQRGRELVSPDDATMVFLYYDLAGITPPIESWVELDRRLMAAPAADKAALRTTIRQELAVGAASVADVGLIRLSLGSAKLSDYDPTYGEFTVRALSPSSMISYTAFRQQVELRFANGREAQTWQVPAAEAQLISDRIGPFTASVQLEVLLRLTGVQPGMSGGTLMVNVLEYELQHPSDGTTLGRVRVLTE